MSYKIRTIEDFDKSIKILAKKYPSIKADLQSLLRDLLENPTIGKSLGNGFYKIRMAISSKGQGKSGGARVTNQLRQTYKYLIKLIKFD